jgi:hypothetical protein
MTPSGVILTPIGVILTPGLTPDTQLHVQCYIFNTRDFAVTPGGVNLTPRLTPEA